MSGYWRSVDLLDRIQAGFFFDGKKTGTASVYVVASPSHYGARAVAHAFQGSATRCVGLRPRVKVQDVKQRGLKWCTGLPSKPLRYWCSLKTSEAIVFTALRRCHMFKASEVLVSFATSPQQNAAVHSSPLSPEAILWHSFSSTTKVSLQQPQRLWGQHFGVVCLDSHRLWQVPVPSRWLWYFDGIPFWLFLVNCLSRQLVRLQLLQFFLRLSATCGKKRVLTRSSLADFADVSSVDALLSLSGFSLGPRCFVAFEF